ncbi:MAG: hypothetical protein EBU84_21495, partial [Actinobacteria bacterium]|nr:hypothetical protein [Actinomycetota bacterium]
MRLSLLSGTPMRSRLPKKSLSSIASWLVVAPLLVAISGLGTTTTASAAWPAGTITASTWSSNTLTSPTDFYLTVTTGTSIELWTTGSGDPMLWLYDKNNNVVAYNDDANGLMSYIEYTSTNPNNGPYRVRAGRCCSNPDQVFNGTSYQLRINLSGSVSSTNNTSSISYVANGGTGIAPNSPTSFTNGTTFTTPANSFSRTGYTFAGWSDGVNTYAAGATYPASGTVSTNVTLTAQWTANTYAVRLIATSQFGCRDSITTN